VIYEKPDRDFSLVYSPSAMLAVSLDVAFSASTALAHLATLPDTWIHSGSCFQVDWCNIDVPVPATGNPLENKFSDLSPS
jgi:hypothetical protein